MTKKSSFGWSELIAGILFIIFGIVALANPGSALGGLVVVYGIVMLGSGIADIMLYLRINRRTGFGPVISLVAGIFDILFALLLLFNIGAGKWVFSFIFPFWFIAHCIGRLANLSFIKMIGGKVPFVISLITNIIGIILGFILLFNRFASMVTLGLIIGFSLTILGIGNIVNSFSKLGE